MTPEERQAVRELEANKRAINGTPRGTPSGRKSSWRRGRSVSSTRGSDKVGNR